MGHLHTIEYGAQGSRIVFLHGLFGQGRNWNTIGKALADEHRITLVDLPDHGRSAWTDRFDYLAVADRVAELIDPADPVHLVGHSMGGKVAMVLALQHPDLLGRLVVADISPVDYGRPGQFVGFIEAMRAIDLDRISRREDADAVLAGSIDSPAIRDFLLQNLRRHGDGWRWQVNLDVLQRDLRDIGGWPAADLEGLAPFTHPVLWLAGEQSGYIKDINVEAMETYFPKVRRTTVKNAGHWLHSEQPEVVEGVLRRYLRQRPGEPVDE